MPTSLSVRKLSKSSFNKVLREIFLISIMMIPALTWCVCFALLITGTFPMSHFIQFWTDVTTFFSYL